MDKKTFNTILYRRPYVTKWIKEIKEVYGFDTEAYIDGKPFIHCISDGNYSRPEGLINMLFSPEKDYHHFVTYNLKYEIGAIIYDLPTKYLLELKEKLKTKYNNLNYACIPHKLLKIGNRVKTIYFWDIQGFYKMSLNKASQKYLHQKKYDIDVSLFTRQYVNLHFSEIRRYCVQDALLTKNLADYLMKKLQFFKIKCANLYSPASVSFMFVKKNYHIIDVWRFWKHHKELLFFACNTYKGGKFEVTARGHFQGYEYDINSAYPYEVTRLLNLHYAFPFKSKKYQPLATYGFLKCRVNIKKPIYHPLSLKASGVNEYPIGKFEIYMTKEEYDWCIKNNVKVNIQDAWWLKISKEDYPYKKPMDYLFKIKQGFKNKNLFMYNLTKLLLNSFYGKMVQLIPNPEGRLVAGVGWNSIYGAIVTANVRIRISDLQNSLKDKCLGVHTDSILTSIPISKNYIGERLGDFEEREKGECLIINSGIYQIGKKVAFRGFVFKKGVNWIKLLKGNIEKDKIKVPHFVIVSWLSALAQGHFKSINNPVKLPKTLDLNGICKRRWQGSTNARKLLSGVEYSIPEVVMKY